jgi:hypothetical protein
VPARPRSALETWNMAGFVPDKSFDRFVMIAYDLEISTPAELQRLIDTVGDLLAKMTVSDQIRLSSFIKNRLLHQMTDMQEMQNRNLELGKSSWYFLPFLEGVCQGDFPFALNIISKRNFI